jgi:hypothetical protein
MRRDRVVVGADHADVGPAPGRDRVLVLAHRGKPVGQVRAGQGDVAVTVPVALDRHQLEVARAAFARPFDDPLGDAGDRGVQGHRMYPSRFVGRRGGAEKTISHEDTKTRGCRVRGEAALPLPDGSKPRAADLTRLFRKDRKRRVFVSSCEKTRSSPTLSMEPGLLMPAHSVALCQRDCGARPPGTCV